MPTAPLEDLLRLMIDEEIMNKSPNRQLAAELAVRIQKKRSKKSLL